MYLYYMGMVFWVFSILWVYPIFQEQNIWMGIVFACLAFCFYFLFIIFSEPKKKEEPLILKLIKTIYLSLLTFILQSVGLWLYIEIFSRWRELTFLSPLFKVILKLFHISVTVSGGNLFLYGVADYVQTFSPNPSNLGLIYLLMFVTGNLSLFFITKDNQRVLKYFLVSLASIVIYLLLRVVFLLTLFINQEVGIPGVTWYYFAYFWHPIAGILTFLPWVFLQHLLLKKEIPILYNLKHLCYKGIVLAHLKPALYLALSIILLLLTVFWIPSGKSKDGRVLFEEYYSDWSKSTRPIDEQWYSSASTYNYYTLRTYLNSYYNVTVNESPLEDVDLAQYDVMIIKIPTKPYPEKVIDKIVTYVRNGGGLWVIGDHTNVFGSTTYLNPLLRHFGLQLRYDGIYHNEHGSYNSIYTKNIFKHPIIYNVPVFLFATPCSLQVTNPRMRIVVPGLTTKAYALSYSNKNFFPDPKPDLNIFAGANTLLAAGDFGQGRVAVFTDSTVFSNFFIYLPGKTELALSIISWLNHRPPKVIIKLLIVLLHLFFGIKFTQSYKQIFNRKNLFWITLIALIISSSSIPVINLLNSLACKMPDEIRTTIKVGFVEKYSSFYLPYQEWRKQEKNNYNTFYIWGQRVGICSRYYFDLEKAIKESKALFMMLPKNEFTMGDLQEFDKYLRSGGKIFLFDHGGEGSSANQFLENYKLRLIYQENGKGVVWDEITGISFQIPTPVGLIKGDGETLLLWSGERDNSQDYPIFTKKCVGDGEIYIYGGVLGLSNREFGSDDIIPTEEKAIVNDLILRIYNMVYPRSN